jgi:hypothetical protein
MLKILAEMTMTKYTQDCISKGRYSIDHTGFVDPELPDFIFFEKLDDSLWLSGKTESAFNILSEMYLSFFLINRLKEPLTIKDVENLLEVVGDQKMDKKFLTLVHHALSNKKILKTTWRKQ